MIARCHRGLPFMTFAAAVGLTAIAISPARAIATPLVTDPEPVSVAALATSDPDPVRLVVDVVCGDPLVELLHATGWRGPQLRIAYAVVWRESNGRPDVVGDGGYGLFQLQKSAHMGKPWWDDQRLMDDEYNAAAAFSLWKSNGWRPWGLTADGDLDRRDYLSWSDWEVEHWIMAPFRKYLDQYDTICERNQQ